MKLSYLLLTNNIITYNIILVFCHRWISYTFSLSNFITATTSATNRATETTKMYLFVSFYKKQ